MSSLAPCQGMPGGSWAFEEDEQTSSLQVPHDLTEPGGAVQDSNSVEDTSQCASPLEKLQAPQTVHSEVVTLDPAQLSEEIVLLSSPTSTMSTKTWRVWISPECDIQVLPPEPHERAVLSPRIRDSPQQRRSRHLDIVFPEFRDSIHSASRSYTNNGPVPSVLDLEWDFLQHDTYAAKGGPFRAGEEPNRDNLHHPDGFGVLGLHLLPASVDGASGDETSATEPLSGISDFSALESHSDAFSRDSDIGFSTQSSLPATETTGTPSVTSTARPSPSPASLRSILRTDAAEVPSSGGRNLGDVLSPSSEETVDERLMLTPTSLADHEGSESLHSMILRLATSSVLSADDRADNEKDSSYELEYLDEEVYTALTPLHLGLDDISLPLSLDSFGVLDDWELVVPLPCLSSTSSSGSPSEDGSSPLPEKRESNAHASLEGLLDEISKPVVAPSEPLQANDSTPLEIGMSNLVDESATAHSVSPRINGNIALEDIIVGGPTANKSAPPLANGENVMYTIDQSVAASSEPSQVNGAFALEEEVDDSVPDKPAAPLEQIKANVSTPPDNGVEDVVEEPTASPSSPSSSDSQFDSDEPTLELLVLDFQTPSLSDFLREDGSADNAGGTLHFLPHLTSDEVDAEAAELFQSCGYSDPPSGLDNAADEPPASPPSSPFFSESESQSDDEPTQLPALDFDTSSLTDSVLRSPEFHVLGQHSPEIEGPRRVSILVPPTAARSSHARAASAPTAERTSILWAPHDTKYLYESVRGPSAKAKGKARARSASEGERVEQEVQTEAADDLRARYARLKTELKRERERARVAALALADRRSRMLEQWEQQAMLMGNVYLPGAATTWEDVIM